MSKCDSVLSYGLFVGELIFVVVVVLLARTAFSASVSNSKAAAYPYMH